MNEGRVAKHMTCLCVWGGVSGTGLSRGSASVQGVNLATLSACAGAEWHRVGGVAALQALARERAETAEEGEEKQAERCDEALVSLGVRRVRRRTAA